MPEEPHPPQPSTQPQKKTKIELIASLLAGRELYTDDLQLDHLAGQAHYHLMLPDKEAIADFKGTSDAILKRIMGYVDALTKQLAPPYKKRSRRGRPTKNEIREIEASTQEQEMKHMLTVESLERLSLVVSRFNDVREKLALEYRELVPQEKKDTFYTPKEKSYSDWKAEYDQTIGSAARPADAPSSTHAPKTAEPQKTQSKTPAKRTSGRGSRPI